VRVLLDTHAFLWWLDGDRRLSRRARALVSEEGNEVLVSAATAWEIAIKAASGKLPGALDVAADVLGCIQAEWFLPLDITVSHAQRAGSLPNVHGDPFDRVLIAQSLLEGLPILSIDETFDGYNVSRVW
jgi:PIN domain nuclease of toxin-antitoxin system